MLNLQEPGSVRLDQNLFRYMRQVNKIFSMEFLLELFPNYCFIPFEINLDMKLSHICSQLRVTEHLSFLIGVDKELNIIPAK